MVWRSANFAGRWENLINAGVIGSAVVPFLIKDKNTKAMEQIVARQEALANKEAPLGGRAYQLMSGVERPGATVAQQRPVKPKTPRNPQELVQ